LWFKERSWAQLDLFVLQMKMTHFSEQRTPMEVFGNVSLYTFDVILRCSMSYEDNVQLKGWADNVNNVILHTQDIFDDYIYLAKSSRFLGNTIPMCKLCQILETSGLTEHCTYFTINQF
jgi:hypothetical protein